MRSSVAYTNISSKRITVMHRFQLFQIWYRLQNKLFFLCWDKYDCHYRNNLDKYLWKTTTTAKNDAKSFCNFAQRTDCIWEYLSVPNFRKICWPRAWRGWRYWNNRIDPKTDFFDRYALIQKLYENNIQHPLSNIIESCWKVWKCISSVSTYIHLTKL